MPVQRRLAAILAADVAGYSRLMGEDEEGTLARFNAPLNALIEPAIAQGLSRIPRPANASPPRHGATFLSRIHPR